MREDGVPWGPLGAPTVVVGAAFLVGAVVWPQAAEAMLRALLVILALGFVLDRAFRADLPSRTLHDAFSPFDGDPEWSRPPSAPDEVRALARSLEGADAPGGGSDRAIPPAIARLLAREARRRLAEDHGLDLRDPRHRDRARAVLAEPTWLLAAPADGGADEGPGYAPVPLSRLERILDDLEEL